MIDRLSDSLVSPKDDLGEAGAPETEIEVTEEMITEGVRLLMNYDPDYSNEDDIVRQIINIGLSANRVSRIPPLSGP